MRLIRNGLMELGVLRLQLTQQTDVTGLCPFVLVHPRLERVHALRVIAASLASSVLTRLRILLNSNNLVYCELRLLHCSFENRRTHLMTSSFSRGRPIQSHGIAALDRNLWRNDVNLKD